MIYIVSPLLGERFLYAEKEGSTSRQNVSARQAGARIHCVGI